MRVRRVVVDGVVRLVRSLHRQIIQQLQDGLDTFDDLVCLARDLTDSLGGHRTALRVHLQIGARLLAKLLDFETATSDDRPRMALVHQQTQVVLIFWFRRLECGLELTFKVIIDDEIAVFFMAAFFREETSCSFYLITTLHNFSHLRVTVFHSLYSAALFCKVLQSQ